MTQIIAIEDKTEYNDKWDAVMETFYAQYPGVDPLAIYCQFTGKPIGATYGDEFQSILDSLKGDPEEIADDIALRLFASMRPSMRWNKIRSETLDEMRKSAPIETLAYLLNRLFTPLDKGNILAIHHDRIRLWSRLEEWGFTESTNTILYYLLEIDAKLGLNQEVPPFSVEQLLNDFESMPILLTAFDEWHTRRIKYYDQKMKQFEESDRWFRVGNTLAKPAFFNAFMESKPPSKTTKVKAEKAAESKFFADLLFEVMGEPNLDGEAKAKPKEVAKIPVPSTKMPGRFGGKK